MTHAKLLRGVDLKDEPPCECLGVLTPIRNVFQSGEAFACHNCGDQIYVGETEVMVLHVQKMREHTDSLLRDVQICNEQPQPARDYVRDLLMRKPVVYFPSNVIILGPIESHDEPDPTPEPPQEQE